MTPEEIRAAIAASPELKALVPDTQALASALSVGRTEIYSRLVSARGMAAEFPGGPIGAEVVLMKLEGAAAALKASEAQNDKVLGSLIARQLVFLAADGLDFGSPALRTTLDQFAASSILTDDEVVGLKAIATRPAPVPEFDVRRAIFADDGTLRV